MRFSCSIDCFSHFPVAALVFKLETHYFPWCKAHLKSRYIFDPRYSASVVRYVRFEVQSNCNQFRPCMEKNWLKAGSVFLRLVEELCARVLNNGAIYIYARIGGVWSKTSSLHWRMLCVYVRDTQPLSRERNISFQLRITSPFDYYTNVAARASAPLIKLRHRRRRTLAARVYIYKQNTRICGPKGEREKQRHARRWTTFCVRLPENKRDIKGSEDKKC